MRVIRLENRITIPVVKIDYVEVDDDEGLVTVVANGSSHGIYYKTSAAARDSYEKIVEAMEY